MKTKMLIPTLMLLATAAGLASPAQAASPYEELRTQSYRGKIKNGSNAAVDLIILGPIPGREESFIGFLLRERPWRADVFMIDPDDKVGYTMTPWKVTRDGEIGFTNINPSHILTLETPASHANWNPFRTCSDRPYEAQAFKVTLAGAGNFDAINSSMVFDGQCSRDAVIDYVPGRYHQQGRAKEGVSFQRLGPQGEVPVAFAGVAGMDGVMTLRRKQIALFNLRRDIPLATGTVTAQFPAKIGFFLRNHGWFSKQDKFILVDPNDSERVAVLERDKVQ